MDMSPQFFSITSWIWYSIQTELFLFPQMCLTLPSFLFLFILLPPLGMSFTLISSYLDFTHLSEHSLTITSSITPFLNLQPEVISVLLVNYVATSIVSVNWNFVQYLLVNDVKILYCNVAYELFCIHRILSF